MIDDCTLINKAKLIGICNISFASLFAVIIAVIIKLTRDVIKDIQQSVDTHINSFESSSVIMIDDVSFKAVLYYASELPSIFDTAIITLIVLSLGIFSMGVGMGILQIRYHQILKRNANHH